MLPTFCRCSFWSGVRTIAPIVAGIIPFAMITAVVASNAGLSPVMTMLMSVLIFAGAVQLAMVQLMGDTAFPLILLTAVMINLRFIMYSASIASYFADLSVAWRICMAYLLTDQVYATILTRYRLQAGKSDFLSYYLGAGLLMWSVWQLASIGGIFLGSELPHGWSLDFFIPLGFLALLMPTLVDKATLAAAISSAFCAVFGAELPFNGGLIMAIASGVVTGLWVDSRRV